MFLLRKQDEFAAGCSIESKIKQNEQLAEELHKRIIRKFEKWKVHSVVKDNIWGDDLADMQLIRKFKKAKKDKKGITITNASQKILDESKGKPNKI